MDNGRPQSDDGVFPPLTRLYAFLAPRGYTVIMFGAIVCTLAVKFFHSCRSGLIGEYFAWIPTDVAVLLSLEVALVLICFRWPKRWVIRTATIIAAVVCTWSVMNAGWLIRHGLQLVPRNLLPLVRDPINSFPILGVNLIKMPLAAIVLLGPSALALAFFFSVLAKPRKPNYEHRFFRARITACLTVILIALIARSAVARRGSTPITSQGLRYNSQARAIATLFTPRTEPTRRIPSADRIQISMTDRPNPVNHNIVIVVLEGIQYACTSLAQSQSGRTPHLLSLARQGVEFANARSCMSHTTKALFGLLTGRYPSASQDLAEAVPVSKPYAGLATILNRRLSYRTAFFQSAKGNFECRPGLVGNLGFEYFHAREDLADENAFVGYLGSDEFAMIEPIAQWIKSGDRPFLLTILCSVTHDPYEIPERFGEPAKEQLDRYIQAISYTDKFIAALDAELAALSPRAQTIFCVVGDHGEAFGEHGLFGHERIAFEELQRIPWVMRAETLISAQTRITQPVNSVDLTPTILALLGFDVQAADFDGIDALGSVAAEHRAYFSCWMLEGPMGFVEDGRKFVYNPTTRAVSVYDLSSDPIELAPADLPDERAEKIKAHILEWRHATVFRPLQRAVGEKVLFERWKCRWWNHRAPIARAEYSPENQN